MFLGAKMTKWPHVDLEWECVSWIQSKSDAIGPFPPVGKPSKTTSFHRLFAPPVAKWWKRKATDTYWPFFRFSHFWSKSDGQNSYVLHYFSTWCPMVTFASQKYHFSLGYINVLRKWNFQFCTCRFGVGNVSILDGFLEAKMTKWPHVEK